MNYSVDFSYYHKISTDDSMSNSKHLFMKNLENVKKMMLQCFKNGYGYKKTATVTGLGQYQVRYYLRRYKKGETSWADKPSRSDVYE